MLFMVGLVLAGLTAFPLVTESGWLVWWATDPHSPLAGPAGHLPSAVAWIQHVHQGLKDTSATYPFLAYGTDWLAFAHLTIAVAFIGPLREPVRNIWVLDFGLILRRRHPTRAGLRAAARAAPLVAAHRHVLRRPGRDPAVVRAASYQGRGAWIAERLRRRPGCLSANPARSARPPATARSVCWSAMGLDLLPDPVIL